MIGVLELTDRRERKPQVEVRGLMGLRCLWAATPAAESLREKRRLRRVCRGAEALARGGSRRVLTAPAFPYWDVLRQAGLRPVETEPFCQALAAPLTLAALDRQGLRPERASVLLSGRRVSHALFQAAELLCPRVRYLSVDAGAEGEELAAWLRAEFGAAVRPPEDAGADVALCFGPEEAPGRTMFHLWGKAPDLAGFVPIPAAGGLPAGLDRLPLLALLWEEGRIQVKQLRFLPPSPKD